MRRYLAALCFIGGALMAAGATAATERYSVIIGGRTVGHLVAQTDVDRTGIDYDYKNNGRGPTMTETLRVDAAGLPVEWDISGATTFGSKVSEHYARVGDGAQWHDSAGEGHAKDARSALYVAQSGSPWALGLYARALLRAPGHRLAALPGGTLYVDEGEKISVTGTGGTLGVRRCDVGGINLGPESILLDEGGRFFAFLNTYIVIVREGYEGEQERLRTLAGTWESERFERLASNSAHRYPGPVRIRNVRVFDPAAGRLGEPVSVVVSGTDIAAVEPPDSPATPGETIIDGAGGTLVPGMFEMHAHLSQEDALLDVLAGITTARDMGNDNAQLDALVGRIDSGVVVGPHVVRSGFIEGKSPFSANNGFVVDSEAKALDAVRWYGARGYWQIKIYNSMDPKWVPAIVREAHRLGMRVAGHVPAFASADQMIEAGYDEITHINQFSLGWVIKPDEDTRTLFRLTALKRLGGLDLGSPKVQHTIGMMAERHLAIDPTLEIHEALTQNRDGQVPPGAADYFDHMPIGWQRDAKKGWIDVSAPGDDEAYRAAFRKLVDVTHQLHDRGVFIVFGTDTGGSFTYHRELELYQQAGFSPADILSRATLDSARYLGRDQRLGSIAKGKLADFFLVPGDPTRDLKAIKTISLVARDGVFLYPSEVYPALGIRPFAPMPAITAPAP